MKTIFFDAACNLCNKLIRFIYRNSRENTFRFLPLQNINEIQGISNNPRILSGKSLVLLDNDRLFFKSDAALKIAKYLKGLWPAFYIFIIIPRPIRDAVYDIIARNRYKWFGKCNTCQTLHPGNYC